MNNQAGPDPLGILASCAPVIEAMSQVTIDLDAIDSLASRLASDDVPPPEWDGATHFHGTGPDAIEHTIGWIFALDALNFCFWAQGPDPTFRWRIRSGDEVHDGYMALAIALSDAAHAGTPVWDPAWLAAVDKAEVQRLFQPGPGSDVIPLLSDRVHNLREVGAALHAPSSSSRPFTDFIEDCERSAPVIVQRVVELMPSFNDVAWWSPGDDHTSHEVRFHKRAQILASDLAGALEGTSLPIAHRDQLTAFADYKVPQVMRELGILRYHDELATKIRTRTLVASRSVEEIEIRAATIWGCELLRQALSSRGRQFTAADVDWLLWNQGQHLPPASEPYHRTVTIFY
jgi:hypothetical protein